MDGVAMHLEVLRLRAENGRLRALVHEVATCPLTLDEDELDYVEVMVERGLWRDLRRSLPPAPITIEIPEGARLVDIDGSPGWSRGASSNSE